jgi:predicted acetyltransferase
VILKAAQPVGFAMVARASPAPGRPRVDYRMAEFFIARTRRRLGIGQIAVQLILSRFAGRWEITEYLRNANAVSFWRRVVASYTRGNYQERIVNGEVRQVFDSGPERSR